MARTAGKIAGIAALAGTAGSSVIDAVRSITTAIGIGQ
jgi:hypothetical protein